MQNVCALSFRLTESLLFCQAKDKAVCYFKCNKKLNKKYNDPTHLKAKHL